MPSVFSIPRRLYEDYPIDAYLYEHSFLSVQKVHPERYLLRYRIFREKSWPSIISLSRTSFPSFP